MEQFSNAVRKVKGRGMKSYRYASADELTLPAKPLAFWNEGHTVTLLMDCEVASVTEDNGIGVFAVAVIANRAFAVLLLPNLWFAIDGCGRTRPRPMGLRRFRIGLWYPLLQRMPLFFDFRNGNFKYFAGYWFQFVALPLFPVVNL